MGIDGGCLSCVHSWVLHVGISLNLVRNSGTYFSNFWNLVDWISIAVRLLDRLGADGLPVSGRSENSETDSLNSLLPEVGIAIAGSSLWIQDPTVRVLNLLQVSRVLKHKIYPDWRMMTLHDIIFYCIAFSIGNHR